MRRGEGGGQEALFCSFFIWGCFDRCWVRFGGARRKSIFSFLVLLSCGVSPNLSLVFTLSGAFHHHRSYGRNLRSQRQRGY